DVGLVLEIEELGRSGGRRFEGRLRKLVVEARRRAQEYHFVGGLGCPEFLIDQIRQQTDVAAPVLEHTVVDQLKLQIASGLRHLIERVRRQVILTKQFLLLVQIEYDHADRPRRQCLQQRGQR